MMDIENTIQTVAKKAKLTQKEIRKRMKQQIEDLSGLIDEEGALIIVAKNLGVDIIKREKAVKRKSREFPTGHVFE